MGDPSEIRELIAAIGETHTPKRLAARLDISIRQLYRWKNGEIIPKPVYINELKRIHSERDADSDADFTFIDLFAGIGGIRSAFQAHGGKCVFTSEWNKYSQITYRENFKDDHEIAGDITQINEHDIPTHDVLLAGFPCQPFSIAGVSKKNALGRPHGFQCTTQGTLFYDVARIIDAKKPKAFLLENVKNLISHDKGRTFKEICRVLTEDLGYHIHHRVIDARHYVPQHRERILIVGFRDQTGFDIKALQLPDLEKAPRMNKVLHPENATEVAEEPFTVGPDAKVNAKYVLSQRLWQYLQDYSAKHKAKGNGFGFGMVDGEKVSRTLSARYHKDGSEVLVSRGEGQIPRRLTPRECARLMGFDDTFKIPVSDTQAYRQFGNSVVVPVMQAMAGLMKPHIMALVEQEESGSLQPWLIA